MICTAASDAVPRIAKLKTCGRISLRFSSLIDESISGH
jgi:hypothetical protein